MSKLIKTLSLDIYYNMEKSPYLKSFLGDDAKGFLALSFASSVDLFTGEELSKEEFIEQNEFVDLESNSDFVIFYNDKAYDLSKEDFVSGFGQSRSLWKTDNLKDYVSDTGNIKKGFEGLVGFGNYASDKDAIPANTDVLFAKPNEAICVENYRMDEPEFDLDDQETKTDSKEEKPIDISASVSNEYFEKFSFTKNDFDDLDIMERY